MFIFISLSSRASCCSLKFISSKLVYKINVSLIILSFYFLPSFSDKRIDSSILGSSLKPYQTGVFRENVTIVLRTFKVNMLVISTTYNWYTYSEKGCRKKCTRQSRKVLWVVLSCLFFKEIWKNGTKCPWTYVLPMLKENNNIEGSTASVSGTVYWSYPILPFGTVACTFFRQPFSK